MKNRELIIRCRNRFDNCFYCNVDDKEANEQCELFVAKNHAKPRGLYSFLSQLKEEWLDREVGE